MCRTKTSPNAHPRSVLPATAAWVAREGREAEEARDFPSILLFLLVFQRKRLTLWAMNEKLRAHLRQLGRRGGLKSRRLLTPDEAKALVRVRDAGRAYR